MENRSGVIDAIAEEMWKLIRKDSSLDWEWCVGHDASTAYDLRHRAECALENSYRRRSIAQILNSSAETPAVEKLDLRFKEAFVNGSGV